MNNLVAYGEDSDEDSPRRRSIDVEIKASPRPRRDSDMFFEEADVPKEESRASSGRTSAGSSKSEGMDFVEPPPPPRRTEAHSPSPALRSPKGMLKVSSVCSLVAYGGDGKDEAAEFDKAEMEGHSDDRQSPPSGAEEPRPPPRISQDGESEDEEDQLIDQANEDTQVFKEQLTEGSSTGSMTPMRDTDSPQVLAPEKMEDDLLLPPSPPGECDPNLQRKFEMFFEKKAAGNNFNAQLQSMSGFLNPSCYESFIEQYDLKEKGSNFDPEVFDPFCYPENCFYDAIAEDQRKTMEAAQAKAAKKGHSSNR